MWKRESIRRELPETGAVGVFKEHSNLLRAEGLMEDFSSVTQEHEPFAIGRNILRKVTGITLCPERVSR